MTCYSRSVQDSIGDPTVDSPPDTRQRVLEATVEMLADRGYRGATTRLVASRAGVSQGALQHHFRSRADLCVSAMSLLVNRLSREFLLAVPDIADPVERFEAIVDRLMAVYSGPTFIAGLELRLAARTDENLRLRLGDLDREVEGIFEAGAREMLPEWSGLPGFDPLLQLTLASIRGVALGHLGPDSGAGSDWTTVRGALIDAVREKAP